MWIYFKNGMICLLKNSSVNCRWSPSAVRKWSLLSLSICFSPSQSYNKKGNIIYRKYFTITVTVWVELEMVKCIFCCIWHSKSNQDEKVVLFHFCNLDETVLIGENFHSNRLVSIFLNTIQQLIVNKKNFANFSCFLHSRPTSSPPPPTFEVGTFPNLEDANMTRIYL